MNEMAIDFATVMAMIKNPPPLPNGAKDDGTMMTDPLPIYANHAFNWQNRSYNDVLVEPYIPKVIAGLTGIDFGFRTEEPATVAPRNLDRDPRPRHGSRAVEGENKKLLKATTVVVTVGSPVPGATMAVVDPPDPKRCDGPLALKKP